MRLTRLMKYIELKTMKTKAIYFIVALVVFGCTRDEEVLPNATFPKTAEIFTDVPVSLTDEFFVSFDTAAGANTNGFGVDENEFFEGTASIRIDVPSVDDPDGSFIGGIFGIIGALLMILPLAYLFVKRIKPLKQRIL